MLEEADYTWVTEKLLEIAYRHADGPLGRHPRRRLRPLGAGGKRRGAYPSADVGVTDRPFPLL